jgi:RNA polymerase sigma factor (sigma-70 family)
MYSVQSSTNVTATVGIHDGFIRELYVLHREELCRYLMRKNRLHLSEAEDVVQTAFARFAAMENPQSVHNPRAFLYRIAINLSVDLQRRNHVQDKYLEANCSDDDMGAPGPERVVEGRQRLGILSRALWGMPKKRRQLLLMSRFDGLSYAEIARRVGLSETVVRKHVNNALADCHKALMSKQDQK